MKAALRFVVSSSLMPPVFSFIDFSIRFDKSIISLAALERPFKPSWKAASIFLSSDSRTFSIFLVIPAKPRCFERVMSWPAAVFWSEVFGSWVVCWFEAVRRWLVGFKLEIR